MTKDKLFEFAKEKGWDNVLEICRSTHSPSEVAVKVNKKESHLLVEFRVMCALGLMQLIKKADGKYAYIATELGIEFLESRNT